MGYEAVRELFRVNGREIEWARASEETDPSFHTAAIQALWIASGVNFEGWGIKREKFAPGKVEVRSGYPLMRRETAGVVENLVVSPAVGLEVLLTDTVIKEAGVLKSTSRRSVSEEQADLRDKLKAAKRYLVCGIMNTRGFYNLVDELVELGFKGELWAMDISSRPLDEVEAYWQCSWKEKFPEIELHVVQADLTAIEIDRKAQSVSQSGVVTTVPEGYFDWVQMDTLGAYISPTSWQVDMPILGQMVKKDGVVVVSDMESYGQVQEKVKYTRKPDNGRNRQMAEWVNRELGWQIGQAEVEAILGGAFSTHFDAMEKRVGEDLDYWYMHVLRKIPYLSAVVTAEKYWTGEMPTRLFRYMALTNREQRE